MPCKAGYSSRPSKLCKSNCCESAATHVQLEQLNHTGFTLQNNRRMTLQHVEKQTEYIINTHTGTCICECMHISIIYIYCTYVHTCVLLCIHIHKPELFFDIEINYIVKSLQSKVSIRKRYRTSYCKCYHKCYNNHNQKCYKVKHS